MSLEQQQELESQYVMHTFARKPVELVSGKGMEVEDAEGNTYLDFIAGIGVCSLGHCHPAITKALQDQSERLIHVSNYYYIEGRGELSRKNLRVAQWWGSCKPRAVADVLCKLRSRSKRVRYQACSPVCSQERRRGRPCRRCGRCQDQAGVRWRSAHHRGP